MEEKKAKVLEQLQLMKETSKQHIEDGNPFFVMHANCAIEFAELAIELLTAEKDPVKGKGPITVMASNYSGTKIYKTSAALVLALDEDGGLYGTHVLASGSSIDQFFLYVGAKRWIENVETEHPPFKDFFDDANAAGHFKDKTDLTEGK